LLDEPASGLDAAETTRLAEHLIRIRDERGLPILLIEHDMSLVMEVSDHIEVLDFGRLIAGGAPDDIRNDKTVISAYLGETSVA
jgi:branched-chain amino acid transport system ATP-binding protein